jgi:glucosylceramidase
MKNSHIVYLSLITLTATASGAKAAPSPVTIIQSTADAQFVEQPSLAFAADDGAASPTISVYGGTLQQRIEGFGGAFTGATATVLNSLKEGQRAQALLELFSPTQGIGFSLMRTHINSNDFSNGHYTYDDIDDPNQVDPELANFSIAHDMDDLIPLIRDAASVPDASFKILASPWSAPAWMKSPRVLEAPGVLIGDYQGAWAKYFSKYLQAYADQGISIWGVTAQNEPRYTGAKWEAMNYEVSDLTAFIRDYLGPTLRSDGFGDVKIFSGDDQKPQLLNFANAAFTDPIAQSYISGVATHWYAGDYFEQFDESSLRYPDKEFIGSEATIFPGTSYGDWTNATRYAHDILGDINNGASGWIDWNMALDSQGGPNSPGVQNPCSAPLIVFPDGSYQHNTQYYGLGHFSKYVKASARKLGNITTGDVRIEASAFENPDGQIAVVVYNANTSAKSVKLKDGAQSISTVLPAGSITTFLYQDSNRATYPAPENVALLAVNGLYVTDPNDGSPLAPTSASVDEAQHFTLFYKADGFVTLKSALSNKYARVGNASRVAASADTASTQVVPTPYTSFERYQLVNNADGTISLKALKNGRYVQAALGNGALQASGTAIGSWEKFVKVPL